MAGIAVAHPLVMRALMEAAQPTRLELADLASELVLRDDIPERHKKIISSIVDDAFEWKFMIFAFCVTPGFAIMRLRRRSLPDPFEDITGAEARQKMGRFIELFAISTASANPLFSILVTVEFLVLFSILNLTRILNGNAEHLRTVAQRVVLRTEERKHATT